MNITVTTHYYCPQQQENKLSLDLYTPDGTSDKPVIVFIHGGAWISEDKAEYANLGYGWAELGHTVALVNYR
ncbi:Alpha/Beta hydrolase protein [Spinellus fusiger]|nr:Alpha/Beta hydrolase protein [Spinellus fusiger]